MTGSKKSTKATTANPMWGGQFAHAPAQLFSTIRSRCQLLRLSALSNQVMTRELAIRVPQLSPEERTRLVALSGGSLGAALRLVEEDGLKLAADAERMIDRAASPDFVRAPVIIGISAAIS